MRVTPEQTNHQAKPPSQYACCYHTGPVPPTHRHHMQPTERRPLTLRKLLEILATVAVLELGFFLFRLGATWWNQ